jgi:glucosyl-dolichyl phosphate glucuronosyltransferase
VRRSAEHEGAEEATLVPTVSVVICAYTLERWSDVQAAVGSVLGQTRPPLETLLVVDHNDELLAAARRRYAAVPGVHVLPSADRRGLSGARNTGVAVAAGEIIAFLDDDAAADPDWLAVLQDAYADPRVMGVGGTATPVWPSSRPEWMPREFDWVVGCSYIGQPYRTAPVRNVIGCNMSLRRSVFEQVGGFSHAIGRVGRIPLGCEETELCIRAARVRPGEVVLLKPAMRVHHRVSENRTHPRYFFRRCFSEGLSKAVVARLVGAQAGLESEKSYVTRVLPRAVLRNVAQTVGLRTSVAGRRSALARAGAVVGGLAATAVGYAYATLRIRLGVQPAPGAAPAFGELAELSDPSAGARSLLQSAG